MFGMVKAGLWEDQSSSTLRPPGPGYTGPQEDDLLHILSCKLGMSVPIQGGGFQAGDLVGHWHPQVILGKPVMGNLRVKKRFFFLIISRSSLSLRVSSSQLWSLRHIQLYNYECSLWPEPAICQTNIKNTRCIIHLNAQN